MYGKLESVGGRLLGLFVPKVDASAAETLACRAHSSCWQCNGCSCFACCDSVRCYSIDCFC
jgi:hypothetical protein